MTALDVRPMREDDREVAFRIHAEAFGGGPEDVARAMEFPLADRWVVTDGGEVVGALRLLRFGHFIGGRSVPSAGIAAVGISPRVRGRGIGVTLMREVLRAAADDGMAFSSLYMSTMAPYRAVGYELTGGRVRYRAALETVPRRPARDVDTWDDRDLPEVAECLRRVALTQNGMMDRSDYWWQHRVFGPLPDNQYLYRYLVRDGEGVVRGYAVYTHHPDQGHLPDQWAPGDSEVLALATRDLVWETPEAATALLSFVAGHWAIATNLYWTGPAADPLLAFFGDRLPVVASSYQWMGRVTDVAAALAARGYPESVDVAVEFRVVDKVLAGNDAAYRLEVSGARGVVERIPDAVPRVTVSGLAAMFTGWLHPMDAVRRGELEGASAGDVAALSAAFAGPSPWMIEFF